MLINTRNNKSFLLGLMGLVVIGFTSCAEGNKKAEKTDVVEEADDQAKKSSNLFEVEGKVFSIPSPIQTALLLKKVGADFDPSLLNPTDKEKNYTTTSSKALNLGIYAADLGYATIYDKSQKAISYMGITKKLTADMGISGIFDEALVKRFERSIGNQDSLLLLVSSAFKKTDQYLKENKQNNISVLVLAGGWIETLHLATNLVGVDSDEAIKTRIGEQKITVKNLINLLLPYSEKPVVKNLLNQLNELKDIYSGIKFTYDFRPPETIEEEKTTIIKSESNIEMTDAQLKAISAKIAEIRKDITN